MTAMSHCRPVILAALLIVATTTPLSAQQPDVRVTVPPPVTIVPAQPAPPLARPAPAPPMPAQPAPAFELHANMDTSGNNPIAWFDLPAPDHALCQAACLREARCRAFAYTAPGKYNHPNPRCWLKDSPGNLTPNADVISGLRR